MELESAVRMLPLKRDPAFPLSYWDEQVAYLEQRIVFQWTGSRAEGIGQSYRPQYVFDIAMKHRCARHMLRRPIRGHQAAIAGQLASRVGTPGNRLVRGWLA